MKQQKIQKELSSIKNDVVLCAKCKGAIGLREGEWKKEIGVAYFDPYAKGYYFYKQCDGAWVHRECLSDKRKSEIDELNKKMVEIGEALKK